MFGKKKADVLVIGAGPVGLFSALALAKQGVRVVIADKEWRTGAHSYALALHPAAVALLEELEVAQEVLDRSCPVRTVGLYDGVQRRAELTVCCEDGSTSPVVVMRQDVLERTLEEALQRAGVKVLWNHSVSRLVPGQQHVVATLDKLVKDSVGYGVARTEWMVAKTFDMEVPFVLGADGHHSFARRALDIEFTEAGPVQHFAVFECQVSEEAGHEMKLNLGEATTDVLWPLPGNRCRWSFQLRDFAVPQSTRTKSRLPVEIGGSRFPVLDEERLQRFLGERAPWFGQDIENIDWRIVVRFEQRLAARFGRDRIWLAGDAGHLTGPAGMQSMNVGLREGKELTEIMAAALDGSDPRERFEQYDRHRQVEWRQLLGLAGPLAADSQTDPWIQQLSSRLLPCLPGSGADLAALTAQIGLTLPG